MRTIAAYVEDDVRMASAHGSAAWVFDIDLWGVCGQGPDEATALSDLRRRIPAGIEPVVTERIRGDEQAFPRDRRPCSAEERLATLAVLDGIRPLTIALVESCPDALLDWDDPTRVLPAYATWRTLRQLAWHIADTESRYYLPRAGRGYRERAGDLLTELRESQRHVRATVESMPPAVATTVGHERWTSTKVLRRLAWHERGELAVMMLLAERGRQALASGGCI